MTIFYTAGISDPLTTTVCGFSKHSRKIRLFGAVNSATQSLGVNRCHCTAVSCSVRVIWSCQKLTVDSKEVLGRLWQPWGVCGADTKGACDVSPVSPQRLHHRTGLRVHGGDRLQRGASRQHHALQGRPLPCRPSSRQPGQAHSHPVTLGRACRTLCVVVCEQHHLPVCWECPVKHCWTRGRLLSRTVPLTLALAARGVMPAVVQTWRFCARLQCFPSVGVCVTLSTCPVSLSLFPQWIVH